MIKALANLWAAILCSMGLAVVGIIAIIVGLPDADTIKHCMTTELYHVRLCETDPDFVSFNQISPYVIGAVIMSEDASFYFHSGIDVEEVKESFLKDLAKFRFARGASTITQQLAKNVFLNADKSIIRKLQEALLALRLERILTKKKILTDYLNVVEWGPGIFGLRGACRYYFNKQPADVRPEEAAFLAFLLPNPKKYSQSFEKRELTHFAEKMVRTILHKMLMGHKIGMGEYEIALQRVSLFPWRHDLARPGTELAQPTDQTPSDQRRAREDGEDSDQEGNKFLFDFAPDDTI